MALRVAGAAFAPLFPSSRQAALLQAAVHLGGQRTPHFGAWGIIEPVEEEPARRGLPQGLVGRRTGAMKELLQLARSADAVTLPAAQAHGACTKHLFLPTGKGDRQEWSPLEQPRIVDLQGPGKCLQSP